MKKSKVMTRAEWLIKKDPRIHKENFAWVENSIKLSTNDGFYLFITESKIPHEGPVKLETNGDTWIGTYVDITEWIGRHFK